jgi:hypothetical protein
MALSAAAGGAAGLLVGGVAVLLAIPSAGASLSLLFAIPKLVIAVGAVPAFIATGTILGAGVGAALTYNKFRQSDDGQAAWVSSIELIPFERDAMLDLNCDTMVGVQQPGITIK